MADTSIEELAEQFAEPPRDFSPTPIWWWSGEPLERERLRWQLEKLAGAGVYNVVILNLAPSGPLFGSVADDPPFLSEAWWEIFLGVCADAGELGVRIYFYDQIGFSGSNLQGVLATANPEFAGYWLACVTAEGSGELRLTAPGDGIALGASVTDLATGASQIVPLEDSSASDGGTGERRLRLVYSVRRSFDYFSAAACQALFGKVHGEMERRAGQYLGNVIAGSFQDELPRMPTWGSQFAAAFKERNGYDLMENLGALWEGEDAWSRRVRADYQATRAALAEAAFFKPLFDWHERFGLICGFDQTNPSRAGDPEGAIGLYADYLRTHRWYTAPGSDHHGEAKIHSSVAHLYNRPRVWIESFHSTGWGGTLEETFDWLLPWLRAGANLYNPHAVYYSTRGGWWEWAPPSTCWRQPYWGNYRQFADAVSRLCFMLTRGDHVCDIGVLYPTTTVQAAFTPEGPLPSARAAHDAYLALIGRMIWFRDDPGVLDRDRRDYDVLDDSSIQRAEIGDGALKIGAEQYRTVVLPNCTMLEAATAAALVGFVKAGGRLIAVGELPAAVAGPDGAALAELRGLFDGGRAQFVAQPEDLIAALADMPRVVDAPVPTLHRRIDGGQLLFVPAAFPRATEEIRGEQWANVSYNFDPASYQRGMKVSVRGVSGAPQLWDPGSGKRTMLEATPVDGGVEVVIPFDEGPAALLVWADTAVEAAPAPGQSEVVATIDSWESALAPTIDNRYGDLALPAYEGAPPVETWRFKQRGEGEADWRDVDATFGTFGWWTGPVAAAELPTPLGAGAVALGVEGWQAASYSLSRGINHDPIHYDTLGPKARVPQEFIRFGRVKAGDAVRFRTGVVADEAGAATLALGAAAAKRAWLNGEALGEAGEGYLWQTPVRLRQGRNLLEWELVAEETVNLRASWAIVRDPHRYARPEWLGPADAPVRDSLLRFSTTLEIPLTPTVGTVQVGSGEPCRVIVNGVEIGRQGGYDPYLVGRVQPHTTDNWRSGENTIVIEAQDQGRNVALVADVLITCADGEHVAAMSGADWLVQRDNGAAQPVRLHRRQWISLPDNEDVHFTDMDPAFTNLWRRPHPLPAADWLEDAPSDGTVLRLAPEAVVGSRVEEFQWRTPPGATRMYLPVQGEITLAVDGVAVAVRGGELPTVELPGGASREVIMRVVAPSGLGGGAVFTAPVFYDVARGQIAPGAWAEQGLASYSGGVRYSAEFEAAAGGRLVLDLGRVRGTAEVWVNGQRAGARVWSPYRFEIGDLVTAGSNRVEVLVCNTLAPYLRSVSPTHYIFQGQEVSGLFGPVTVSAIK